jgi:hypothetical protein
MKKLILFSALCMLCRAGELRAQLQKGTKYAGATVSFSGQNGQNDFKPDGKFKANTFGINPGVQFGKFVKDNVMLGVGLGTNLFFQRYKNEIFETESETGVNSIGVTLNPYIRNYKSLSPKWAIFLHSGLSVSYLRHKDFENDNAVYENGYSVGIALTPGISYWFSPRFSLESDVNVFSLGVNYTDFRDKNDFGFSAGISSSVPNYFGVRASWYLQKAN